MHVQCMYVLYIYLVTCISSHRRTLSLKRANVLAANKFSDYRSSSFDELAFGIFAHTVGLNLR